jgi:hypothetical protein
MTEIKITDNPFGQWIKQEFVARQARPAANDFEKGHLEAMLTLYHLIGEAAFDDETHQLVAGLETKPPDLPSIKVPDWFKAELTQANQRTSLSEYEMGYLHTILGTYFATEPAQPDPELLALFEKFTSEPAMVELAERFDMETRTLHPTPDARP